MRDQSRTAPGGAKGAAGIPFGYRAGNSPLHRCPAPVKLLALLVLSAAAYQSVPALGLGALVITLGALVAGIRPWELLRGSLPVLFLASLFFALRIIGWNPGGPFPLRLRAGEIPGGAAQGLSMLVSFAAGALFFAVTTMKELRDGLGAGPAGQGGAGGPGRGRPRRPLPSPLRRGGLALSLMLGFLPRFFEAWEEANLACSARGAGGGIRRLPLLIPPVTERMIEKALDTALALEARGLE
jgi:energy-coupling factor transporter transmembrane protein EcfT